MKTKVELKEMIQADNAWLGLEDILNIPIDNPLLKIVDDDPLILARNLMGVMAKSDYIHLVCKLILNLNILPVQNAMLQELWERPFPMLIASRGFGKSFCLAVYAILRCLLKDGSKVVVVGSGFRQSKLILEYMEAIWRNAPVLRDICNKESGLSKDTDRYTFRINNSYVIGIPIGDGSKIRGLRAHLIIADEFNSIRPDIYETVIAGFAAVSKDPFENVRKMAKRKFLIDEGLWLPEHEAILKTEGNQAIISGTAGFDFEHFADYWKRYKKIIESKGDKRILEEVFKGEIPDNFSWKDYSVIRIPYELIPEGFMDDRQVVRARATIDSGIYLNEYGACFSKDSSGFFKRSLIESCVASDTKPVRGIWYDAMTTGNPKMKYVFGIDPASERDNFSLVILELQPDHNRVVYCWSTTRKDHISMIEKGIVKEHNFYAYCARKIRTLMKSFPCIRIGMDQEGGGRAVSEALHDKDKIGPDEQLIWPVIDPDKEQDSDHKEGMHIIELINFSKADWVSGANHGLKKDFEDKVVLFPRFDNLALGLATEMDQMIKPEDYGMDYLENCIYEIEELKNELSIIIHTKTDISGRDRWDTPEVKTAQGRKGRLRKDRYSAMLIANMLARVINRSDAPLSFNLIGRTTKDKIPDTKRPKEIGNNLYKVGWDTFRAIKRR
jgi:hypothetical protein